MVTARVPWSDGVLVAAGRAWWRWLTLGLQDALPTPADQPAARAAGDVASTSDSGDSNDSGDSGDSGDSDDAVSRSAECERFVRQHERAILNYLWRVTGDQQTAYDLTQEVFLRAWQRFAAVRAYEQPRGWLFRVATNLALTHLRRASALAGGLVALDDEHSPAASDPAWRLAEGDAVRRTLLRLTPGRRAALVLREVYDMSSAEVGQTLGMSDASVRTTLHRAREQFRTIYLNEEGGHERD